MANIIQYSFLLFSNLKKNTKRHKTQKTHLVILCLITSHIYGRVAGPGHQTTTSLLVCPDKRG